MPHKETYENFVRALIERCRDLAADENIFEDSDFYRGYRGGLRSAMKAIEDMIEEFEVSPSNSEKMLDVDSWFKDGQIT